MESKQPQKDRLGQLFRQPAILFSSCRASTTAIARHHLYPCPSLPSSACCGCRPAATPPAGKEDKPNKKEGRVSAEQGGEKGRTSPPASPSSLSTIHQLYYYSFREEIRKQTRRKKKKKKKIRRRKKKRCEQFSVSAIDDHFGFFSSEDREEKKEDKDTETFFTSRSFSSEPSDFYKKSKKKNEKTTKRPGRNKRSKGSTFCADFQPLVSISSGRRKEDEEDEEEEEAAGIAVKKKSRDPYSDFRSSMVEMIVERQIFGDRSLRWLLRSYLSLNSPQNHPAIIRAFADISQVLFSY